jgi:hypothetical protein
MEGSLSSFYKPMPLPVLGVRRWLSKSKSTLFLFVGSEEHLPTHMMQHIQEAEKGGAWHDSLGALTGYRERPAKDIHFVFQTVWPDDSILYALTKVLRSIGSGNVLPFAWNSSGILRFQWPTLDTNPEGLNPWEKSLGYVDRQPLYTPYRLVGSKELNIVLYDDIREALDDKQRHMYFPDARLAGQLLPERLVQRTEFYLEEVWTTPAPTVLDVSSRIRGCSFTASHGQEVSLSGLYEQTSTTHDVPLIQWTDDITRVMYKLYKKHRVRANDLRKWTERYHIPKTPSLVMYEVPSRSGTHARVQIQEDGEMSIVYSIDAKETTFKALDDVEEHARGIADRLREMLEAKSLPLRMANISYDVDVRISTLGLNEDTMHKGIMDAVGNALPLFFMVHVHAERRKRQMVFLRASNLRFQFGLAEVVQSLLDYGVESTDIQERLLMFGYDRGQIDSAMEEVKTAHLEGRMVRRFLNMDSGEFMVLSLEHTDGMFHFGIRHAPDTEEAARALKWLSSVVFHAVNSMRDKVILQEPELQQQPRVSTPSEKEPSKSSSSSFEFDGGAGDGFLLDRLQKADKTIFANPKTNYARGCQQDRQPLIMTKDEWDKSKTKVENSILYRGNYYCCPTIWCKEAGIVMTKDELNAHNGKCPGTEEKPVILWREAKGRFVGFNKNVIKENGKDIYSPCCFKSDKFEKQLEAGKKYEDLVVYRSTGEPVLAEKKQVVEKEKPRQEEKDTYIFKMNEPVQKKGRYGNVPKALHKLFFPQFAEQGNNISTQPTIVRHGIGAHSEDSLMASIAYTLGIDTKRALVEELVKVLDPMTFICLEGGAVLSAFAMDGGPQMSYSSWSKWVHNYPEYMALMGLEGNHKEDDPHILRERKVYEAYLRFVHHLESDDKKNLRMLYNLLAHLGVMLMVWERDGSGDDVKLSCPYFIGYNDMREMVKRFKNRYIMLLYDGSFYEPLEIRTLNKPPIKEIPLDEYPMVKDASLRCPVAYYHGDLMVVERLRGLVYWTRTVFWSSPRQYMPKTIVLGTDMRIEGMITHGNVWVSLPRPSVDVLPRLTDVLSSIGAKTSVQYHEDIDIDTMSSMVYITNRTEFQVWRNMCSTMGFQVLERTPPPAPVVPVVPIASPSYEEGFAKSTKDAIQWRDTQLRIARYMLYQYETKVAPHAHKPRKEFLSEMLDLVAKDLWNGKMPMKVRKDIKTSLEEMPLAYGKDSLQKWMYMVTLAPYRFYDSSIYPSGSAWTFSQLAVEMGLPKSMVSPSAAVEPTPGVIPEEDNVYPIRTAEQPPRTDELPMMALPANTTTEDMPKKWKNANIQLLSIRKNMPEYVPNLCQWLSWKLNIPIAWDDIVQARYIQIASYLGLPMKEFKEAFGSLILEPTFRKALARKKMRDEELLEQMWSDRVVLTERLKEISDMSPSPVWPMDIDFRIMAQVYDMFILIIMYRKPYTVGKKEATEKEDMRLSSLLYSNSRTTMDRPLLMLYRNKDGDKANVYSLVLSEGGRFYFDSASVAPNEVRAILHAHRNE